MKKYISFLLLLWVLALNAKATNINKPVAAQYGFIENKGQIIDQNNQPNPSVLYLYNGNGLRVQLRKGGFSYEVIHTVKTPKTIINEEPSGKFASAADSFDISHEVHRVDINFKGGNKHAVLKPYEAANDYINYYTTATPEEGITQVQHFQKVIYENVYPNIDIEFVLNDATNRGKFKYNFIVKPNANLADIQLEFIGANHTSLNKAGNIFIETAYGNLEENIPLSYVINSNKSHSIIEANFITLANNIFGINAANYNHNQTLVIDPTNWATYYGGSGTDESFAIATDTDGNIVITGRTNSTNAIATIGAHQSVISINTYDALVVKFNSNGIIQWATYYGGSGGDDGYGVVTDSSKNILIIGYTSSTNAIATSGAHQTTIGGFEDAFIAKFNTNGIRQWATYYGGSVSDYGLQIKKDINEDILLIGFTSSPNGIATVGAHQTTFGGITDAFITKFNSNGIRQWATYYGGTFNDSGAEIEIDANGNIIILGQTQSLNGIATIGSHQPGAGANEDAFIAKFNSNGVRQWATYYGGAGNDYGGGIGVDTNGNIIITGYTSSPNAIATIGSHQSAISGVWDAFIAKFNGSGIRQWATYYGGTAAESALGIMIDFNGNIIITGGTSSTNGIATIGAYQVTHGGGNDAFIAKFNSNGIRQWATYYGDNGSEAGRKIAMDISGNIIVTGSTASSNAMTIPGAHQTIYGGGSSDAFIAKFSPTGILPVKLTAFNAVLDNKKVNCTWETASEINNNYFTVERSTDGNHFESIGRVKGQGNTNINTRYRFTDNNPFEGISYYRLKQTDYDNTYTYSPIQRVGSLEKLNSTISLYYENNNPIVKINAEVASNAIIELISLAGIPLFTQEQATAVGENAIAINSNGTSGFYLLKVQLEDKVAYFKVWMR